MKMKRGYEINNFFAYTIFSVLRATMRFLPCGENDGNEKILFVNLGRLGDVVLSSSVFANEKRLTENRDVVFVAGKEAEDLFANYKGEIKILFIDKKKYKFNFFYRIKTLFDLRRNGFTEAYNLSFTRISVDDEICLLGACAAKKIAFRNNIFLSRAFGEKFDKRYDELIDRAGKSDFSNIIDLIERKIGKAKRKTVVYAANGKTQTYGRYFALATGAKLEIKKWGKQKYALLAEKLTFALNLNCVIIDDEPFAYDFKNERVIDKSGKTALSEAVAIINDAEFFVGNDSALLHVAKALNKRVFGIVGGGVYGRIYPYDENDDAVYFYEQRDCFGCDWQCEFEKPFCLTEVKPDRVIDAIIKAQSGE